MNALHDVRQCARRNEYVRDIDAMRNDDDANARRHFENVIAFESFDEMSIIELIREL